jgi:flagellar basal-body rod protein FlgC
LANAQGYVTMPNVNPAEQMVDMISASRGYQMNVEVMNMTRQLMLKTLDLGK